MGSEVCRAVDAADDMHLVASADAGDDREPLRKAQVVVDFTTPDVVMDNLQWCIDAGVHAVVGTTGFDADRLRQVRDWLGTAPRTGVLIAPNFGIAAGLMIRCVACSTPPT